MNASHTKLEYRPDVDGLRAVALLFILAFHAFPEWVHGRGFVGPDVFFVISGYLISTIIFTSLARGTFAFGDFYARRARRVFPALILALAGSAAIGWVALSAEDYQQLGKHVAAGAGFVSNFALLGEVGYFDKAAHSKPFLHLWTLAIEEQFYIVWPLLLWSLWRLRINMPVAISLLAAISFAWNVVLVRSDAVAAFYLPHTRFWELLAGALLAWATLHSTRVAGVAARGGLLANIISVLGFGLLACGFYAINDTSNFPGLWAAIPVAGTVLVIAAGKHAWLNRVLLANRPMVGIGLISYPLYLWHWPLLTLPQLAGEEALSLSARAGLLLLSCVLGALTYILIERPLRFGGWFRLKTWLSVVLLLVTGLGGYAIYRQDGVPQRFPDEVRKLAARFNYYWPLLVRTNQCHLQSPELSKHDPICYETRRPLLVLWGDSHAASLYPGLNTLQRTRSFGVTQLTQAGCSPMFDLPPYPGRPDCNLVNRRIFEELQSIKPDILVLQSVWRGDPFTPGVTTDDVARLFPPSLAEIHRKLPNTRIIVIGPVPRWQGNPRTVALLQWQRALDKTQNIPAYLPATLLRDVDALLADVAAQQGVEYISAIEELCKGDLCLARVGDNAEDYFAVDYAHFSKAGSEYFVRKIEARLLGPAGQ